MACTPSLQNCSYTLNFQCRILAFYRLKLRSSNNKSQQPNPAECVINLEKNLIATVNIPSKTVPSKCCTLCSIYIGPNMDLFDIFIERKCNLSSFMFIIFMHYTAKYRYNNNNKKTLIFCFVNVKYEVQSVLKDVTNGLSVHYV